MTVSSSKKRKGAVRLISMPSMMSLAKNFLRYNFVLPLKQKPFLPRAMTLYVTYRCNLRCRMCGIWNQEKDYISKDLTLAELDEILNDPLFYKLEFVNINGGEPNLREDLVEIVRMATVKFPHLTSISLNTNGIPPKKTAENVEKISSLCQKKDIRFSVSLSLHAVGEKYDQIAGVKGAYSKVQEAFNKIKILKQKNEFYLSANCVITNMNLNKLEDMLAWSQTEAIPVNFVLGEVRDRFSNMAMESDVRVRDIEYLVQFLRGLSRNKATFFQHALRYSHLADMIGSGQKRGMSCHYALGGLTLGPDGCLCYCPHSTPIGDCREKSAFGIYFEDKNLEYRNKSLFEDKCKKCPVYSFNRMEVEKDLLKLVRFLYFSK